jgi:Short C-terminal domain
MTDRGNAAAFAQQVNTAMATYTHQAVTFAGPTVAVPSFVAPTAKPASAAPTTSAALTELASLRDQGHITAAEYESKRREILARL